MNLIKSDTLLCRTKQTSAIWSALYKAGLRKHRHRCRCCNTILCDGDSVLIARIGSQKTLAIHEACSVQVYNLSSMTWRAAMETWGERYLASSKNQ